MSRHPSSGFLRGSKGLRSSTCNQSGKSCTSSRPSFFFCFRLLLFYATGCPVALHSYFHFFRVLDFSVYVLTSNTESCDEDGEEACVGVVEELVDKPGNGPNIHKAFACRCPSKKICTFVGEWHRGYFYFGYFSSSTHFHLVIGLARKVWRQCVLVFAHDLGYRGGNGNGLLANTGLFLSTPINPFRFLTTAPDSIVPRLASKFRNRSFCFILLSTIVFSTFWQPISSDESPCRTIPIRF